MTHRKRIDTTLKEHRIWRGLTQGELARKVNVSTEYIRRVESGLHIPNVLIALDLARVIGVPVERLFMKIQNREDDGMILFDLTVPQLEPGKSMQIQASYLSLASLELIAIVPPEDKDGNAVDFSLLVQKQGIRIASQTGWDHHTAARPLTIKATGEMKSGPSRSANRTSQNIITHPDSNTECPEAGL